MRPADAEREWKLALAFAPDNALLLNNLGLASARRKENQEATVYFERSMRLRPNYTDAHLNLGRLDVENGQLADAEAQLQTAVALAPLSIDTRNELGKLYFNSGRYREARAQFESSAASIPNATAYDFLGDLALRENRNVPAEQNYRNALAVEAFDYHAHFGLGRIYQEMGRRNDALVEYRAGLGSDPLNADAKTAVNELTAKEKHDPKK
jgi:Tfp pilus assembly protein PilF